MGLYSTHYNIITSKIVISSLIPENNNIEIGRKHELKLLWFLYHFINIFSKPQELSVLKPAAGFTGTRVFLLKT
jgi:hypothetical protein